MKTKLPRSIVLLALALIAFGCGGTPSGPTPLAVTGKILRDGKPMTDGTIYFQSADGKVPLRSLVVDGSYTLQAPPGEYRVAIQQERDSGTKNMYGDPQMMSTVAARYNTETTLKATVTEAGPQTFDFAVQSQ